MAQSSSASQLQAALSTLFTNAVSDGVVPGMAGVVFNREGVVSQGFAGVANVDTGAPFNLRTTIWQASKSKAVNSVAALILVEREGFDIDSHDALVKILPELKVGGGEPATKVFGAKKPDGTFEVHDGKRGITLRHLLSHTAGFGYGFHSQELASIYEPVGPVPSVGTGKLASINVPRQSESGEKWMYGVASDWIGLFIERVYGKLLPAAYKELVFDPLGIHPDELSAFCTKEMEKDRATIHMRIDGPEKFTPLPLGFTGMVQYEDNPPEGHATLASGPLHGTVSGYATFARSLLNRTAPSSSGKPLISEKLWEEASGDNLARTGLSLPPFILKTVLPSVSSDMKVWSLPADETSSLGEGWTLLQTVYNRERSASGRQPGTLSWAGLANSYFFVDPISGVGGVIATQMFPFADERFLVVREDFERLIYTHREVWEGAPVKHL